MKFFDLFRYRSKEARYAQPPQLSEIKKELCLLSSFASVDLKKGKRILDKLRKE